MDHNFQCLYELSQRKKTFTRVKLGCNHFAGGADSGDMKKGAGTLRVRQAAKEDYSPDSILCHDIRIHGIKSEQAGF